MNPLAERPAPRSQPSLYESPEIYDVAFGWNLAMELDFLESCLARHVADPVRSILEPACGTGRILAALVDRGYEVTGYDLRPEMVAFAAAKVAPFGGRVMRGDMATFKPPGLYDAAINLVNSIGYLLEDDSVTSHLERVAESLRPGGVYLVQFSYGGEPPEQSTFGPWANARGGLETTLTWRVEREDPGSRRSYQQCHITARRGGEERILQESHVLRYWTQEDFDRLVEKSPFELAAVYFDRFEEHPLGDARTGADGNLYHVLRRRDARRVRSISPGGARRAPRPDRWEE
ncbi:MAG TPA: class I SAM-dependent methyltransferase [Candidatus Eisenbacteria bacterium]|nr:class I SAM-dependent methyltransferase [Candidatus Eisenbacteria bacterium]